MRFDGLFLPFGVAQPCSFCGLDGCLDIVSMMRGAKAEGWLPGFSVFCNCGTFGQFAETRIGALFYWNEMVERLACGHREE